MDTDNVSIGCFMHFMHVTSDVWTCLGVTYMPIIAVSLSHTRSYLRLLKWQCLIVCVCVYVCACMYNKVCLRIILQRIHILFRLRIDFDVKLG